jgi:hypothetical protein
MMPSKDMAKEAERQAIAAQVAEYLARGGQIRTFAPDVWQCPALSQENQRRLGLVPESRVRRQRRATA